MKVSKLLVTVLLGAFVIANFAMVNVSASCGGTEYYFDFFASGHNDVYNGQKPVTGIYKGIVTSKQKVGEVQTIGDDTSIFTKDTHTTTLEIQEVWKGPHKVGDSIILIDKYPSNQPYAHYLGKLFDAPVGEESLVFVSLLPNKANEYIQISFTRDEECVYDEIFYDWLDLDVVADKHLDNPLEDSSNSQFREYILNIYFDGIDNGYPGYVDNISDWDTMSRLFKPNQSITRGEFVKMLGRAFDIEFREDGKFEDVMDEDGYLDDNGEWYYHPFAGNYANTFKSLGIINGFADGKFHGSRALSRGEAAKMLVNVLEYKDLVDTSGEFTHTFSDINSSNVFEKHIAILNTLETSDEKIVSGYTDGTFKSEVLITRNASAKIVDLARKYTKP